MRKHWHWLRRLERDSRNAETSLYSKPSIGFIVFIALHCLHCASVPSTSFSALQCRRQNYELCKLVFFLRCPLVKIVIFSENYLNEVRRPCILPPWLDNHDKKLKEQFIKMSLTHLYQLCQEVYIKKWSITMQPVLVVRKINIFITKCPSGHSWSDKIIFLPWPIGCLHIFIHNWFKVTAGAVSFQYFMLKSIYLIENN